MGGGMDCDGEDCYCHRKPRIALREAMKQMPSNVLVSPTPIATCNVADPGGPGAHCKLDKGHSGDHNDDGYIWANMDDAIETQARVIARYQKELDKVREELSFYKRTLETKVSEHVKDIDDLQGVIKAQREEILRLKELLYP